MKKTILIWLFVFPFLCFGQSHSWDGKGIASNAKVRCLNIFVNIIYDVHPDYNNHFSDTTYWPPVLDSALEGVNNTAIPKYLLDWMDTVYVPGQQQGTCTRVYGESSFDSLQIIGDFVVVNLRESTARAVSNDNSLTCNKIGTAAINLINVNGLQTIYGHNRITDYDYNHDGKIDFINLLIRNIKKPFANINPGSGYVSPPGDPIKIEGNFYFAKEGTKQCVGDKNFYANPTNIVIHEVSHNLFGGNEFHTSGGNHRETGCTLPFLNIQFGYGLMGAGGSGLVCCNGYERWRMHWKHPQSTNYISARDITNTQSVISDISKESGNRNFILRDFITYGDVVRIRLPYKDSVTSSNQYIWLENHKVGSNNKLDFLQYSNTSPCRPSGAAGIYAYYQIGRDILEGTSIQVWDGYHCDNLKIIPAEGYYDYELYEFEHQVNCVSYDTLYTAVIRGLENPFCGNQDQEMPLFPRETDTLLYLSREFETWRKYIDTTQDNHLPQLGDNLDAFSTHTKINMGTNPSTCNAKTYHSKETGNGSYEMRYIVGNVPERNVQTTYLTGLSIEMTPIQGTGNFLVNIRWDDYDITNDTRWTGKISLKDTAILTTGNTITLAQNKTVAQPKRDSETGLFAGRTRWICENGSYFRQDSASVLILTENSSLIFKNGSCYELSKGARVEIQAGCSLAVQQDAKVQLKGIVEVDSGGVLILYDTAKMGSSARIIVRPGGKLVVDGGTLTSACPNEMWQGVEVVGDRRKQQLPQYQGTVELRDGATIKNAHCGIRTGLREDTVAFATTGGIIIADSAFFVNNRRAVEFLSYTNYSPSGDIADNQSHFTNCEFSVNDNNLFAQNSCSFIDHVTMCQVRGVEFNGCTFKNTTTAVGDRRHAINAEDAGFIVSKHCRDSSIDPNTCSCPEPMSTYCVFTGFSTAIEVNTTGYQHNVKVDFAQFNNNRVGVCVNSNQYATVTRCDFNLQDAPFSLDNTGLIMNCCTGYKVEENRFHKPSKSFYLTSTGILVNNSGVTNNSIYRNVFDTLDYGIRVTGINGNSGGGLQMTAGSFTNTTNDIHIAKGALVSPWQGTPRRGADNAFVGSATYNIYNAGPDSITYYHSNNSNYLPNSVSTKVGVNGSAATNPKISTLCDPGWHPPFPLAGFQSSMNEYTTALSQAGAADGTGMDGVGTQNFASLQQGGNETLTDMRQSLSDTYYEVVRTLMSDTVLDLNALEQWHTAAQPLGDPYSLTETRFMLGYSEPFVADADDAELSNYAEFHAFKVSLRDNASDNDGSVGADDPSSLQPGGHINWYALTPSQIAQLRTIAERNTGRASVMAKGVLCFFHGICYEDEWYDAGAHTSTPQQGDDTTGTRAKRTAMDTDNDATLSVYPNPTDDVLFIELFGGAEISIIALYDLQGRVVETRRAASLQKTTASLDVRSVPAGVYILRVTDTEGKEYHRKIVRE